MPISTSGDKNRALLFPPLSAMVLPNSILLSSSLLSEDFRSMLKTASLLGIAPYSSLNTPWSNGEINHLKCSLGEIAASACREEVMLSPKPGLVDPDHCGHHQDMDIVTFLKSADALAPHWKEQARIGLREDNPKNIMPQLRARGILMENSMFSATVSQGSRRGS